MEVSREYNDCGAGGWHCYIGIIHFCNKVVKVVMVTVMLLGLKPYIYSAVSDPRLKPGAIDVVVTNPRLQPGVNKCDAESGL
jgi:hypothetical protein